MSSSDILSDERFEEYRKRWDEGDGRVVNDIIRSHATLTLRLQQREAEWDDLRRQLTEAVNAKNTIAERDAEIARLMGELANAKRVIKEKDAEIERLQIDVQAEEANADDGAAAIARLSAEVERLKGELVTKLREADVLHARSIERDTAEILRLTDERSATTRRLDVVTRVLWELFNAGRLVQRVNESFNGEVTLAPALDAAAALLNTPQEKHPLQIQPSPMEQKALDERDAALAQLKDSRRDAATYQKAWERALEEKDQLAQEYNDHLVVAAKVQVKLSREIDTLEDQRDEARDRAARLDERVHNLQEALKAFAERGHHHDTNPTKKMKMAPWSDADIGANESWWIDWLKSADDTVRQLAKEALMQDEVSIDTEIADAHAWLDARGVPRHAPQGSGHHTGEEFSIVGRMEFELTRAYDLIQKAAQVFRQYERMHLSKSPPDDHKAKRNGEYAEILEGFKKP